MNKIAHLIQTSPVVRGTCYLGSAIIVLETAHRLQNPASPFVGELMHATACPMMMMVTSGFKQFAQEIPNTEKRAPLRRRLGLVGAGFALGSSSYLIWLSMMAAGGWATFPGWGWTLASSRAVVEALVINTIGHLAVAMNEEQVFRGYGFDTWRQAIGPVSSAGMLLALFTVAHRPTSLAGLSGFFTLGLLLTGMRLTSGSIWLPVGFHWGWNLVQTGILGHDSSRPSLRPVQIDGPESWTGKTSPETGWATSIVNLIFLIGMLIWRSRRVRVSRSTLQTERQR
jgi:membrane protease YdiL (CAAX protease family)